MKVNCVVLYLNGGKIKIIIRNHILGDVIAMDTVYMDQIASIMLYNMGVQSLQVNHLSLFILPIMQ